MGQLAIRLIERVILSDANLIRDFCVFLRLLA